MLRNMANAAAGISAAGTNGGQTVFGFKHVAVTRQDQRIFTVGHNKHGLKATQHPVVRQPRKLNGRAHQITLMLELGLKALLKREGIGRGTRKAGKNLVVIKTSQFTSRRLGNDVAHVTWPSPPMATSLPRRTQTIVVA